MIAGRSMLERVYERAVRARYLTKLLIATDDERIADAARSFGAMVRMTRQDHPTGTDRLAEVASAEHADLFVNIQGDEPLIEPDTIDAAVLGVLGDKSVPMGSLRKRLTGNQELHDPNVVKVTCDLNGDALYFSRAPIPYTRDPAASSAPCYKHIGLYVYRRDFLLLYPELHVGPLERAECLEQLRALENGYRIRLIETDYESIGVDTPADLARVNELFAAADARLRDNLVPISDD